MTADVPRTFPSLIRLGEPQLAQLLELVTGQAPEPGIVAALEQQTGGEPRLVLAHLLVALCDGKPPLEVLAEVVDAPPKRADGILRHEGDYWTVVYGGRTVRLRDARGWHFLAPLLVAPGRSVHVRDLIVRRTGVAPASTERARQTVTKGIKSILERLRGCHPRLAEHLATSIHRGYACRYEPGPGHEVAWRVELMGRRGRHA